MDPDTDTTRAKYAHNRKVMFGSAILLFLILLVIVFYHACRHVWVRRRRSRRRRHLFAPPIPTDSSTASNFSEGLDPSLLKFLPIFTFSSATHRPLQDCAVCLSEFADGDEARLLPNCNHAFHSHCIDTWFRSHSNCPLCREPVHQPAAPVQPLQAAPPTASSNIEPRSVPEAVQMEEGQVGCSSFPAIGCAVKPIRHYSRAA